MPRLVAAAVVVVVVVVVVVLLLLKIVEGAYSLMNSRTRSKAKQG